MLPVRMPRITGMLRELFRQSRDRANFLKMMQHRAILRAKSTSRRPSTDEALRKMCKRDYAFLDQNLAEAIKLHAPSTSICTLTDEYNRQDSFLHNTYVNKGRVVGMGSDEGMQLGVFNPDDKDTTIVRPTELAFDGEEMRMIRAGGMHSVALSCSGIPYTWGCNDDGALGRHTRDDSDAGIPMPVTGFVNKNGTNEDGCIMQIAAGDSHTLFLSTSGAVYMCGCYRVDGTFFRDQDGHDGSPFGKNNLPVHVFQMQHAALAIFASKSMNAALLNDRSLVTWGTKERICLDLQLMIFVSLTCEDLQSTHSPFHARHWIFRGARSEYWHFGT
jgi:Regulator of chromosome condensation (RCC1) repeat